MTIDLQSPALILGTALAVFAVLLLSGSILSRRRLRRWCDQEGYRLVSRRGARFYEGPRRWRRFEAEDAYRIEVEDRHGMRRTGFLHFDRRWWPLRSRRITAHWD